MSQLAKLAKPFPKAYVSPPAQGKYGEYVPHHTVNQALLATLGPFDLEVKEVLRGREGFVEGAVIRCVFTIDGERVVVEEAGDCESPSNWKTDGARLKDAVSDGLKRCAMRVGLGLHLWCQDTYFLDKSLKAEEVVA